MVRSPLTVCIMFLILVPLQRERHEVDIGINLWFSQTNLSVRVLRIVADCCALRSIFGEQPLMSLQRANFLLACKILESNNLQWQASSIYLVLVANSIIKGRQTWFVVSHHPVPGFWCEWWSLLISIIQWDTGAKHMRRTGPTWQLIN